MRQNLVFLHGFLESSRMWDGFLDSFTDDFNVVCLDFPGHGEVPVIAENQTMELMADYVKQKLEELKIEKAIFIGHSMGGYVALEIGKKYPQLVQAVSMFFSSAAQDDPQKKIDRDRAVRIVEINHQIFIKEAIPFLFAEENKTRLKKEIRTQTELALKTPVEGITACLLGMRDRVSNIKYVDKAPFPIQFIVGQKDPVIRLNSLDNQLSAKSVIDVEIIENCGHMGHIEEPEQSKKALKRFFKKV
ncbi:MAG: alpha/beta fold hydrolase [Flavobacteriales bacterium]|nr:alpha/beta fold hydrolase [Flavobacteriales bacterium]